MTCNSAPGKFKRSVLALLKNNCQLFKIKIDKFFTVTATQTKNIEIYHSYRR